MSRPDFGKGVPDGVSLATAFELNESSDEDCPAGDLARLYEMWRQSKLLYPDDPGYIGVFGFRLLMIFLGAWPRDPTLGCYRQPGWMPLEGNLTLSWATRPLGAGKLHASSRLVGSF